MIKLIKSSVYTTLENGNPVVCIHSEDEEGNEYVATFAGNNRYWLGQAIADCLVTLDLDFEAAKKLK